MKTNSILAVLGVLAGLVAMPGHTEDGPTPAPPPTMITSTTLTGTLAKANTSGAITIGYRDASIPFSYLDANGQPIGYSIELCRALVHFIESAINKHLTIKWAPVTSDTRINAVVNDQVDLECGSTTNNLERQKRVAFSPTFFVSGTKLLVKKGSSIRSFRDLAGKKVTVTSGTTNEKTMLDLSKKFNIDFTVLPMRDHAESFAQITSGQADAFATDDVLLYGLIAQKPAYRDQYAVVGDFLSYDPYGIMYRKDDPQLAKVINTTFRQLAQDGEIERQYKQWFLRKLPSGANLNMPMSPHLETILETLSAPME